MSMSLDGFVAGPHVSIAHPMGVDGERLHDWLFSRGGSSPHAPMTEIDKRVTEEVFANVGAVIMGKRTFDAGLSQWGDTPYPVPNFVLTHTSSPPLTQKSGIFTFVSDGIDSALRQAQAAAGERNIILMGADISQQYLKAGLVDEIDLNLVPVLLIRGVRLFEHIGAERIELKQTRVLESAEVTHLKYKVIK